MKGRDSWAAEQEQALKIYDDVRRELLRIPGVVEVGVGIKETGGKLTEEVVFRVYVIEKLPETALPPEQVIPKTIRGFRTDVIKRRDRVPIIGFSDEDDWKNYSTKVGGIRIGSQNAGGTGTLGCFCMLLSDGSVVFLSNHHVLLSGSAAVGSKVGQPQHEKSCCCTCNEIGQVHSGTAGALDCAIGTLNLDVPFFAKVKTIKRGDGTTELNGFISGSGAAVLSEEVWKVGARTGLTRGTITDLVPDLEVTPTAAFPRVANRGDSGSVVVSLATSNVVGLLKSIDTATETLGFATPIASVLSTLGITVLPTPPDDFDVLEPDEDGLEAFSRQARESAFAGIAERLESSEAGREVLHLFRTHRRECLDLVNKERAVTVAWRRNQGPAFLAALARSAKEPIYRIPQEIEGVSRERAAMRMAAALNEHAGDALLADLRLYGAPLVEAFARCDTVAGLITAWEEMMLSAPAGPVR